MITTLFAMALAFQVFIFRIVIPDNVRTARALCNAIGAEYERTGFFPRGPTLKWSDLKQDCGLAIQEAAKTGYTKNRWGQEIALIVAQTIDLNGTQELHLEVISRGPLAFGYASHGNTFTHDANDLGTPKSKPDGTMR